jgi:hypothetical protein
MNFHGETAVLYIPFMNSRRVYGFVEIHARFALPAFGGLPVQIQNGCIRTGVGSLIKDSLYEADIYYLLFYKAVDPTAQSVSN